MDDSMIMKQNKANNSIYGSLVIELRLTIDRVALTNVCQLYLCWATSQGGSTGNILVHLVLVEAGSLNLQATRLD